MESTAISRLSQYRDKIRVELTKLKDYEKDYEKEIRIIEEGERVLHAYEVATDVIRQLSRKAKETFHKQIQEMVTYCLKEVFGEDAYEFKIKFELKNGKVVAEFVLVKDNYEYNPLTALGGGVLSVCCFALRLSVIYLTRNTKRSIMLLDEPFSQLSVEYRDRVACLLHKLANQFNFQFIMVTHADEFMIGRIYRFDSNHTATYVGENYT